MAKRLTSSERAKVARAAAIASHHFHVFRPVLFLPNRNEVEVAEARQIAMYLAHCAGRIPINRLTIAFKRDNSTISHNIAKIEDMRDDPRNPVFEAMMTYLTMLFQLGPDRRPRSRRRGRRE